MQPINYLSSQAELLAGVQVLVVDNDRDSGDLYAVLFASYGAKVTIAGSIRSALDLLDQFVPNILICELRFLGEQVYPLIQQIRNIAFSNGRAIPILVTSTYFPISLAQHITVEVEGSLLKPLDIDQLVYEVLNLTILSNIDYPPCVQAWIMNQNIDKTPYCSTWIETSYWP